MWNIILVCMKKDSGRLYKNEYAIEATFKKLKIVSFRKSIWVDNA